MRKGGSEDARTDAEGGGGREVGAVTLHCFHLEGDFELPEEGLKLCTQVQKAVEEERWVP